MQQGGQSPALLLILAHGSRHLLAHDVDEAHDLAGEPGHELDRGTLVAPTQPRSSLSRYRRIASSFATLQRVGTDAPNDR